MLGGKIDMTLFMYLITNVCFDHSRTHGVPSFLLSLRLSRGWVDERLVYKQKFLISRSIHFFKFLFTFTVYITDDSSFLHI